MLNWENPGAWPGLCAALLPLLFLVVVRLNPTRLQSWGAMRILKHVHAAQRGRLQRDLWILTLLRMLAISLVALSAMGPVWEHSAPTGRLDRSQQLGAIVWLDDSASSAIGDTWKNIQENALAYLDTLRPGDAVQVLPMSACHEAVGAPIPEISAARKLIQEMRPGNGYDEPLTAIAASLPALKDQVQPGAEIVIVEDGRSAAWHDTSRHGALERQFVLSDHIGTRRHPRVVVLRPNANERILTNTWISDVRFRQQQPTIGQSITCDVTVQMIGMNQNNVVVRLLSDGVIIGEQSTQVSPSVPSTVTFITRAAQMPGDHQFIAQLIGNIDVVPLDDQRHGVIVVAEQRQVMILNTNLGIVVSKPALAQRGAAIMDHMLSTDKNWRVRSLSIETTMLKDFEKRPDQDLPVLLVVVGSGKVEPEIVARIEQLTRAGMGVLFVATDRSDPFHLHATWWRNGSGIFPSEPLGWSDVPGAMEQVDSTHPLLATIRQYQSISKDDIPIGAGWWLASENSNVIISRPGTSGMIPVSIVSEKGMGRVGCWTVPLDRMDATYDLHRSPYVVNSLRRLAEWLGDAPAPVRTHIAGSPIAGIGTYLTNRPIAPPDPMISTTSDDWDHLGFWSVQRLNQQRELHAVVLSHNESNVSPAPNPKIPGIDIIHSQGAFALHALLGRMADSRWELWGIIASLAGLVWMSELTIAAAIRRREQSRWL